MATRSHQAADRAARAARPSSASQAGRLAPLLAGLAALTATVSAAAVTAFLPAEHVSYPVPPHDAVILTDQAAETHALAAQLADVRRA